LACGTERIILLAGESSLVEQWVVVVMVKVGIAPKTSRRKLSFLPCDLTLHITALHPEEYTFFLHGL
jgi:hypothetical protein